MKTFGNIVCLHSGSRVWYGSKQNTREYELYVFIPSGQAFMARNVVCGGYVLLAVLLYMFFVLCKNHTEKENLEREHKRLQIIDALGLAYSSISLVDLGTETVEVLKGAEQVNELIAEPYRKAYLEFTDMATVAARLDGHASLSFTAQTEKRSLAVNSDRSSKTGQAGADHGCSGRSARCDGGAGKGQGTGSGAPQRPGGS